MGSIGSMYKIKVFRIHVFMFFPPIFLLFLTVNVVRHNTNGFLVVQNIPRFLFARFAPYKPKKMP